LGLSFLEPWLARRPGFGRDLPDITVDFKAAGHGLGHALYAVDAFPWSGWAWSSLRNASSARGCVTCATAYGTGLHASDVDSALGAALSGDRVEFGHLDEAMQEQVLREFAADVACAP
jgi:hypothetical protein